MPKNFNLLSNIFNLGPKTFKLLLKKFNWLPKKFKISGKKIKIDAENIQNSAENIQNSAKKKSKINNRVNWILSKRVCDVITIFIASLKSQSARGVSHHPPFMGNCPIISHTFFSLIYPVDEFSLKEIRMWGQSKILSYYFFVWCKPR